ncbi:MAG TPA: hypothetical protein VEU33_29105 [Archangium sp.]|nr:hypothetical protein [Archangium sp.]
MIVPIDELMSRLKPFLSKDLVGEEEFGHVNAVARLLPEVSGGFCFECRMEAGAPRVDYMVCCMRTDGGPQALADALEKTREQLTGPLWDGVRAFSRQWVDPASPLARVPVLWLEYDVEGPTAHPKPFAFACVQPEFGQKPPGSRRETGATLDEPLQLTWRALEAFQGGPVRPAIARTVSRCFEQLPDFAEVEHVASLACRGSDAVRMIIGMPREEVGGYLERIGWPGSRAQVEELTKTWLNYLHFAEVNLDVGETVGPTIGLALPFPEKPHEPWAKEFLQRMVDLGLCTPEKREAILQWPGRERVPLTGHRWPSNLCRTIGAKLVVRPDAPVSVKVYPYFECRFSLWSDV